MNINKLIKLTLASCILLWGQSALAVGASKVAVLDVRALIHFSDVGQEQVKQMEKSPGFAEAKARTENIEADLKAMGEKLKTDGLTWGDDKKKEHQEKMNELAAEGQQIVLRFNQQKQYFDNQLRQQLEPAISVVLKNLVAQEGIDLVIDAAASVYHADTVDITPMMVPRLNAYIKARLEQAKEEQAAGAKTDKKKK